MKLRQLLMVGIVFGFALSVNAGRTSSSFSASRSVSTYRPSATSLYNKPAVNTSRGYVKPTMPTSNPQTTNIKPADSTNAYGYQKPTGQDTGSITSSSSKAPTAYEKGNRFETDATRTLRMQKSQASLAAYDAEKSKFKAPPPIKSDPSKFKSDPVVGSTKVYSRVGYDDIQERRREHFNNWNPPVVIYNAAPSYGSWSSTFLWWSLWNDQNFFYHHRNDPAYQVWHDDAVRLAEQNGEMKEKLAELESRMSSMQQNGVTPNAAYLPTQVADDPLVALSAEAIDSIEVEKPTLRLATGIKGGQYSKVGNLLKKKAEGFNIELISTSGAAQNLALLNSGKVDAAIVQSDTDFVENKTASESPSLSDPTFQRATLYCEYVMLIVGENSGIKSVNDLGKDNVIYVGPKGSGTAITWDGFVMQDSRYKEVRVQNLDYPSAFEKIAADKKSALLFVAGVNAPLLSDAAKTGKYKVVPVDDKDLSAVLNKNGHAVYSVLTLPANTYKGMQNKELKTLGVDAEWTLSDKWIKKVGHETFDHINYAVIDVIKDLHKTDINHHGSHIFLWGMLVIVIICVFLWFFITRANVI